MNQKMMYWLVFLLLVFLTSCSTVDSNEKTNQPRKIELTISAAASLSNVLAEIKTDFEKSNQQITLLYNLGGSGALKQQIIQGAPADLFISAAKDQFDDLTEKGLLDNDKQMDLLSNQLVLITNKLKPTSLTSFEDLKKVGINKLAIGTPESVPAGMYAKQTLEFFDIWEAIQPKTIQTKDVRQVLTYVATGSVDAGIVYMTDVQVSDKVKVVAIAEERSHDLITYSAGIIKKSAKKKEASLFYDYLQSKSARTIFEKYGFKVLD
jgi:molybdate transport system substrate-binding protein